MLETSAANMPDSILRPALFIQALLEYVRYILGGTSLWYVVVYPPFLRSICAFHKFLYYNIIIVCTAYLDLCHVIF